MNRNETKLVKIGNITCGNDNKVLIQSMCNIKTSHVKKVIKQINECTDLGADMMRVSILDFKDAYAIKEIVNNIKIPLICDIHFNYKFAIIAIKNGASKIRLNPGNLKNENEIKEIVELANKYNVAIRIGVNSGSLDSEIKEKYKDFPLYKQMVFNTLEYIKILEKYNFHNIVISLKSSNLFDTINAYKEFSKISNYPLHIGLTESGFDDIGIIRSVACLSPLLLEGIGNTIRISLTSDPKKEILTCKRLLHDLGLYENYPTLISCPTCGRTMVNVKILAKKTLDFLVNNNINITVAIMGCAVNGICEGKKADIGLAGGKNKYIIFKKGKFYKEVDEKDALNELFKELLTFKK